MRFNYIWTKEKNDKMRQMFKEHKTHAEIREYFGDDVEYHPSRKFAVEYNFCRLMGIPYINKYKKYLPSIEYNIKEESSKIDDEHLNFFVNFSYDSNNYNLILLYNLYNDLKSYNISLNISDNITEDLKNKISYILYDINRKFLRYDHILYSINENEVNFNLYKYLIKNTAPYVIEFDENKKYYYQIL